MVVLYCYFNITSYLEWFRTRTSGNNNPVIFPRMGGYFFLFLCKFWFYRRPSPTCPADRQPLSRDKVFNHEVRALTGHANQQVQFIIINAYYHTTLWHVRISKEGRDVPLLDML